jgi:transposase
LAELPARARLFLFDETALRLWPPLRAAWARVGHQARVPVSGRNAQRSLYCAVNLRTGRRITLGRTRQRQGDFQAFLRRLRHGRGAHGPIYLVLDHHSSHTAAASLRLARELNIELVWLPKQCPNLNPVEHLWRELKGRMAANRQFETIQDELRAAETWVQQLTGPQTFRKAGLCSPTFWLHELYKNIRGPT